MISFGIPVKPLLSNLHIALSPLLRVFLQLGQTLEVDPSAPFSSLKFTSTSDLSEYEWLCFSEEPGQIGANLIDLFAAISFASVLGVSDGTQNDGKADLLDSVYTNEKKIKNHKLAPQ